MMSTTTTPPAVDRLFHDVTVTVNDRPVQAVEFLGAFYLPNGQPLRNAQQVTS